MTDSLEPKKTKFGFTPRAIRMIIHSKQLKALAILTYTGYIIIMDGMRFYDHGIFVRGQMNTKLKHPDGPNNPALLQMLEWIANPIGYMEAARERYGDIFTLQFGFDFSPHVFISNPQAIEQIFTSESKEFSPFSESFYNFVKPFVEGHSILMASGKRHRRKRQLLMPPFHGEQVRAYGTQICSITEQVMSQLPENKPFCVRNAMLKISLEVIFQVVFGSYEGERCQRLKQLLCQWLDAVASPIAAGQMLLPFLQKDLGTWSPWGRWLRLKKQLSELLYTEIRERRHQSDGCGTDILTLLLRVRDETGEVMTDEELHDELLTLLGAGHETTAISMTWALLWVYHLPSVGHKLLEELKILGDSCEVMAIFRLPYLTAVCCEVARIYPVFSLNFPHQVTQSVELIGYQLPPGTKVVANIYLTHHREDLYPQPKQFKPERFLERQFSPYEYLPFGGGIRRCLGAALAQLQIKLVLATIVSRYQLVICDNQPLRPHSRLSVLLMPRSGVKMMVTRQEG